jgi:hypothetical protein
VDTKTLKSLPDCFDEGVVFVDASFFEGCELAVFVLVFC